MGFLRYVPQLAVRSGVSLVYVALPALVGLLLLAQPVQMDVAKRRIPPRFTSDPQQPEGGRKPQEHVNRTQRCGWEVQSGGAHEMVVEVLGFALRQEAKGPMEQTWWNEEISLFWSVPDWTASWAGMRVSMWVNCENITHKTPNVPIMGETWDGHAVAVSPRSTWVGEHTNRLLAQMLDERNVVVAQGEAELVVPLLENVTEGLLHNLSNRPQERTCAAVKGREGCSRYSRVSQVESEYLDCTQPRMPLRIYELTNVRWAFKKFDVWMRNRPDAFPGRHEDQHNQGRSGADDGSDGFGGVLRVHEGPIPNWEECGEGGIQVAYVLMGVAASSAEHFGHFVLDVLVNLIKMLVAMGHVTLDQQERATSRSESDSSPEGAGGASGRRAGRQVVYVLDDVTDDLFATLPGRAFYDMMGALMGGGWMSVGELSHGTCVGTLVLAFGALEVIRSEDAGSIRSSVNRPSCGHLVRAFRWQIWRHFNLEPRELDPQSNTARVAPGSAAGRVVYLPRGDATWRRLVNERELVSQWNEEHGGDERMRMHTVQLHTLSMAEQLTEIAAMRVLIAVNGGQINSLFFLSRGATCAAIFAERWTDANFGYVHQAWLKHAGVRYMQYNVVERGSRDWLEMLGWGGQHVQDVRDADIRMPYDEFETFVHEAAEPEGVSGYDAKDDTDELQKLLLHLERFTNKLP